MSQSLAIAGHFRQHQLVGGVASFFQNLTRGMQEVIARDPRFRDLRVTVFHGPAGVPYRAEGFDYREASSRFGRIGADVKYGLLESGRFDASLFPNYFRPPIVRSGRSVVVFHDLFYKNLPELLSWPRRFWLSSAERFALSACDAVITISAAVKQDVLRWFGDKWEPKIYPVWNPIAFERLEGDSRQTVTGGRPYILGVAVDRPSKNLPTLIRGFHKLRERFPDYCLVLAGELRSRRPKAQLPPAALGGENPSTVDLVRDLNLGEHVKVTGFVSDAELGALYRGATAFVLPSLFEGFGMPPVEALALGVPTLVSDIPVLRECTLGAAHYIEDPKDADALSEAMGTIVKNPEAARPTPETIDKVRRAFAPQTIAAKYLDVVLGH